MVMNEIEYAYLAGVLDSDGSFSIAIDTWRQRHLGRNPAYQEIVAIGQCDPQAIQLAKELFGGSVRAEKARAENRRPMFYWQATNKIAVECVRALLPYLRIKRRQAELILALRAIKDRGREENSELTRPRVRTTKPAVLAEMAVLAVAIRQLNDSRFPLALSE